MTGHAGFEDERSQRIHRLLVGAGPATPPGLRARLAAMPRAPASRPRPIRPVAVAGGAALAVLATVLVLTLVVGAPTAPTVADAAEPSARAATAPSPPHDLRHPALLAESFQGVTYPYWYKEFNWFAAGERTDDLGDGRIARTVFYRHTRHRIGYTVVSGKPLRVPSSADRRVVDGVEARGFHDGDRYVVTFVRNGHTCLLAGMTHSRATLYKLASWHGDGALRF